MNQSVKLALDKLKAKPAGDITLTRRTVESMVRQLAVLKAENKRLRSDLRKLRPVPPKIARPPKPPSERSITVKATCSRPGCELEVAPCTRGKKCSDEQAKLCFQHRRSQASMECRARKKAKQESEWLARTKLV